MKISEFNIIIIMFCVILLTLNSLFTIEELEKLNNFFYNVLFPKISPFIFIICTIFGIKSLIDKVLG